MASPDHKRRWAENNPGATAIPSRPPLKKRFTSNINISVASSSSSSASAPSSSTTSPTVANGAGAGVVHSSSSPSTEVQPTQPSTTHSITSPFAKDPEKILLKTLSKNAWLKRMQDAKVECSKLQADQLALESDCINLEASKGIIRVQLNMIHQGLLLVAKSKRVADTTIQHVDLSQETDTTDLDWLAKAHSMAKELQVVILDHVKTWTDNASGLEKQWQQGLDTSQKHGLLTEWLLKEMEDLRASYQQEQACLSNVKQGHSLLSQQSENMIKQLQLTIDDVERSRDALDDCTTTLMQIEKRHERSKSKVIAALASGGLDELTMDTLDAPTTPTSTATSPATATATSISVMSPSSSSAVTARGYSDTDIEPGSIADQTMKSQLSEHQLIVDTRNKELSALKMERQSLAADIDRLRLQFARIPDEQLAATDYYKNLQTSYEYYRHRAHHLDQMRTSLDRTLDDLARARKRWMDDLKSEKTTQSTTMESEMKRLENDLTRIRGQKDQFKSQYDDQVAKELKLKDANQLVIESAEKEKQYIESLESRLQELKSDTTVAGPLAQDLKSFNEFHHSLQKSKYSLKRLQEMEQNWNPDESQRSVATMKKQITFLRAQLELWKSHGDDSNPEQHKLIKALMTELAGYSAESQKLSLMVDLFEKTETQLLDEIDRMASIYGRLEEQRLKKIFEEEYKPEYKSKLMAEKSKFAQTFPSLVAARDKQLANVTALRHTSDKQKDLIAQLQEHEKSLELQLSGKENDNWRTVQSVEDDKSMVEALTQQLEEAKNTLDSLDAHVLELQKVLKEKARALEEEKQLQTQVEEDHDKMKRKWDMISHGDNPQEQQLAEECDELRSLLKCGTCRTRFRSHLITRCMHTFCKKCIDARLETRQRRCPTCGESFGANDVRQFYL